MFETKTEGAILWSFFQSPWSENDGEAYLASLQALGDRVEPFVLISVIEEEMEPMAPKHRREQAIIFKKLKPHLQKICLGMVRVRGNGPPPDDGALSRGFGWPVVTVATREEGQAQAELFLTGVA